jgi:membrane associated rhomboid family serine protease
VIHRFWVWQLATYMFLHGGIFHILFNMLALWMFGTDLERRWGTRYFLKFYFVTGIGAGALTVLVSLLPFEFAQHLQGAIIIGASGAVYGLLLAYAMYFPERTIILYVFPLPAKIFVAIAGAIALFSSLSDAGGLANATHLGGLLIGYLLLKSGRIHPMSELKYRYLKFKINRVRKKFDVYSGGRADDWDRRVH